MSDESTGGLREKLQAIRALWLTAHNDTGELEPVATEFFFAIGELLEGAPPDTLKLKHITRGDFLKELRDD